MELLRQIGLRTTKQPTITVQKHQTFFAKTLQITPYYFLCFPFIFKKYDLLVLLYFLNNIKQICLYYTLALTDYSDNDYWFF